MNNHQRKRQILRYQYHLARQIRTIMVLLNVIIAIGTCLHASTSVSVAAKSVQECKSEFVYPVQPAQILREFSVQEYNWLSGHRGIDLLVTNPNEALLAPQDGVIRFSGMVANKPVVSIRHKKYISTFEPATTSLKKGEQVYQGSEFAYVDTNYAHCEQVVCVHWGVKIDKNTYVNPKKLVQKRKIVLKPL